MSKLKNFNVCIGDLVLGGRHLIMIGVAVILVASCCAFLINGALNSDGEAYEVYQDKVKSLENFSGFSKSENGSKGGVYVEGKGIMEGESQGYGDSEAVTGISSINMTKIGTGQKVFNWNGGSNYLDATE